jgi:hypothetical protein
MGSWVGYEFGLGVVVQRKIPDPIGNRTSFIEPIAYSLYGLGYTFSQN